MFPKSVLVAFLAFSLSLQGVAAQKGKQNNQNAAQCAAPKTVTNVVTVTRGAVAATKTTAAVTKTAAAGGAAQTSAAATGNNNDPQKSTTLDPRVLAAGFANDGQDVPTAGQVASLTSTNNFINFCLTVNLPITNGKQITTGSCNPAPIGAIPSVDNMPSSKFTFPTNFGTIKSGTTFTVSMAIQKMQTGFFVNAQESYFAAPQQLNAQGQIQGHSHVVIEQLTSLSQTTPTDPKKFMFFKGLNAAAVGGKLTAEVTGGLAPGFYKLSSINSSSNHQPVIAPIAQHGSLDDAIYFTVTTSGQPSSAGGKKRALERRAISRMEID